MGPDESKEILYCSHCRNLSANKIAIELLHSFSTVAFVRMNVKVTYSFQAEKF